MAVSVLTKYRKQAIPSAEKSPAGEGDHKGGEIRVGS
jgi:hypothetical protein